MKVLRGTFDWKICLTVALAICAGLALSITIGGLLAVNSTTEDLLANSDVMSLNDDEKAAIHVAENYARTRGFRGELRSTIIKNNAFGISVEIWAIPSVPCGFAIITLSPSLEVIRTYNLL